MCIRDRDKVTENIDANKENSVDLKIAVDNAMNKIKVTVRILTVFGIIDFLAFVYICLLYTSRCV